MNYEIEHSGILGMKWGNRRYQYKDGSLTPAGRSRYGVGPAKKTASSSSKNKSVTKKTSVKRSKSSEKKVDDSSVTRNVKDMSDDEIRSYLNRKKLEDDYIKATAVPKGENLVQTSINKFGQKFLESLINTAATSLAQKVVKSMLGDTGGSDNKKK